jgi:hypothetical protein
VQTAQRKSDYKGVQWPAVGVRLGVTEVCVTSVKISENDCKVMLGRVAKQISGNSVLGAVVVVND